MKQKIIEQLLGTYDLSYFISAMAYSMLGALISLLIHATNRDKTSMRTPLKFSWSFLFSDNATRIYLNLLLIIVTVRFCEDITGKKLTMFVALTIGVFYDKLLEFLRNKCVIDVKA